MFKKTIVAVAAVAVMILVTLAPAADASDTGKTINVNFDLSENPDANQNVVDFLLYDEDGFGLGDSFPMMVVEMLFASGCEVVPNSMSIYGDHLNMAFKARDTANGGYDMDGAVDMDLTLRFGITSSSYIYNVGEIMGGDSSIGTALSFSNTDAIRGFDGADDYIPSGEIFIVEMKIDGVFQIGIEYEKSRYSAYDAVRGIASPSDVYERSTTSLKGNSNIQMDIRPPEDRPGDMFTSDTDVYFNIGMTQKTTGVSVDRTTLENITTMGFNSMKFRVDHSAEYNGKSLSTVIQPSPVTNIMIDTLLGTSGEQSFTDGSTRPAIGEGMESSITNMSQSLSSIPQATVSESVDDYVSTADRIGSEISSVSKSPGFSTALCAVLIVIGVVLIAFLIIRKQ